MSKIKAGDDIFFTVTMAEVMEAQGHCEDALMIYKILADSNPQDASLSERIERLKSLAGRSKRQGGRSKAPQGDKGL